MCFLDDSETLPCLSLNVYGQKETSVRRLFDDTVPTGLKFKAILRKMLNCCGNTGAINSFYLKKIYS